VTHAAEVRNPSKMATPMTPAIGGDAEAAAQSAQALHPSKSTPELEEKSFAKTRGMSWYTYLLAAAAVVIGIGLLVGTMS